MSFFLENLPSGFATGCAAINELPNEKMQEMCQHVIQVLKNDSADDKILTARNEKDLTKTKLALNTVTYIFRTAKYTKPTPEEFSRKLKSVSLLDEEPTNIMTKLLAEQLHKQGTSADHLLSVGKLLDMQWKVGLATSSSECRNLNKPFVTVVLKLQQSTGNASSHTMEMTIPEFKEFSTQIRNLTNILETA